MTFWWPRDWALALVAWLVLGGAGAFTLGVLHASQPVALVVGVLVGVVAWYAALAVVCLRFERLQDRGLRSPAKAPAIDRDRYVLGSTHGRGLDNIEGKNLDGIPWYKAPVPPRRHKCWPQTEGWVGFDLVVRCACGAIARDNDGHWMDRNQRCKPAEKAQR